MPISKKITEEIDKLDISNEEKELLVQFLKVDESGKQYSKEYDRLVKEFIDAREKVN